MQTPLLAFQKHSNGLFKIKIKTIQTNIIKSLLKEMHFCYFPPKFESVETYKIIELMEVIQSLATCI